jgi:UDP-glucose 4-epimerase
VIAIFCGRLEQGGRPTIFGDGTQTRDYIYVGDVVSAAIAAGESTVSGPINIGTGRETTVLELAEALRELGGAESFEPELAPPRTGEVQRVAIDARRAERELGWRAEVGLEDGLRLTLDSI